MRHLGTRCLCEFITVIGTILYGSKCLVLREGDTDTHTHTVLVALLFIRYGTSERYDDVNFFRIKLRADPALNHSIWAAKRTSVSGRE